jgi:hypothetical protein
MANIGSLNVSVYAKTDQFNRKMSQSAKMMQQFSATVKAAAVAAAGAFVAFSAGRGLKDAMESIDKTAKSADKLGVTTEALIGLQHAGNLAGIGIEEMDKALVKLTRTSQEAAMGSGEAQSAFKLLGLDAQRLARMSPDQRLLAVADAMKAVSNQGDKILLSQKIFGKEGATLIPLIQQGSEAIKAQQVEAEMLGITYSRFDAAKVEMANDAMTKLGEAGKGVFNLLSINLAPTITTLIEKFIAWATESNNLRDTFTAIGSVTGPLLKGMLGALDFIISAWMRFKAVIFSIQATLMDLIDTIARIDFKKMASLKNWKQWLAGDPSADLMKPRDTDMSKQVDWLFKEGNRVDQMANEYVQRFLKGTSGTELDYSIENMTAKLATGMKVAGDESGKGFANSMADSIDNAKSIFDALKSKAKSIFEATRTPLEKMNAQVLDISDSFFNGLIDQDTMKRAALAAGEAFKQTQESLTKTDTKAMQKSEYGRVIDRSLMALGGPDLGVKTDTTDEKQLVEQKKTNDILQKLYAQFGLSETAVAI